MWTWFTFWCSDFFLLRSSFEGSVYKIQSKDFINICTFCLGNALKFLSFKATDKYTIYIHRIIGNITRHLTLNQCQTFLSHQISFSLILIASLMMKAAFSGSFSGLSSTEGGQTISRGSHGTSSYITLWCSVIHSSICACLIVAVW